MIHPAFAYAKAKALITAPLFSPCMLDLVGNTIDRFSHEVSHIFFKYLIISFNSEISSSLIPSGPFMLNIFFCSVTTLTKS